MKCPNCSADAADGAAECPACGVVFEKWLKRREAARLEAADALARMEGEPSKPPINPWVWRSVAIGIVVAWLAGLTTYLLVWGRKPAPNEPQIQVITLPPPAPGR